eukprot:4768528-Amphidinium_carterae.1
MHSPILTVIDLDCHLLMIVQSTTTGAPGTIPIYARQTSLLFLDGSTTLSSHNVLEALEGSGLEATATHSCGEALCNSFSTPDYLPLSLGSV